MGEHTYTCTLCHESHDWLCHGDLCAHCGVVVDEYVRVDEVHTECRPAMIPARCARRNEAILHGRECGQHGGSCPRYVPEGEPVPRFKGNQNHAVRRGQ